MDKNFYRNNKSKYIQKIKWLFFILFHFQKNFKFTALYSRKLLFVKYKFHAKMKSLTLERVKTENLALLK